MNLASFLREIPDYPKPGILFYDISPLLAAPEAWAHAVNLLAEKVMTYKPDLFAAIDARGFLVAGALGFATKTGVVMVRKAGKLPGKTIGLEYALEYGTATLEAQADAFQGKKRVVVIDDLLATGGTLQAAISLIRKSDCPVIGVGCLVELPALRGREKLDVPVETLIRCGG